MNLFSSGGWVFYVSYGEKNHYHPCACIHEILSLLGEGGLMHISHLWGCSIGLCIAGRGVIHEYLNLREEEHSSICLLGKGGIHYHLLVIIFIITGEGVNS